MAEWAKLVINGRYLSFRDVEHNEMVRARYPGHILVFGTPEQIENACFLLGANEAGCDYFFIPLYAVTDIPDGVLKPDE